MSIWLVICHRVKFMVNKMVCTEVHSEMMIFVKDQASCQTLITLRKWVNQL
jgi:hypothetical protein